MATTSYQWQVDDLSVLVNNVITAGNQLHPAITAAPDFASTFVAWVTPGTNVEGRGFSNPGSIGASPIAGEVAINATAQNHASEASVAVLQNSHVVVTYTDTSADPGGDIRGRLLNADGSAVLNAPDFAIEGTSFDDSDAHVAALADGGFVVTWTRNAGGGDNDIYGVVYNADGSVRKAEFPINIDLNNTSHSSVAGLPGGNFVVAWEESPAAGGDTQLRYRTFSANGTPLNGTNQTGVILDNLGQIEKDVQIAALPDGGFAVAYVTNDWSKGGPDTDILVHVFDADGKPRAPGVLVNAGDTLGDQAQPSLTVTPNGIVAIAWKDVAANTLHLGAFDAGDGHALSPGVIAQVGSDETRIVSLGDNHFQLVSDSNFLDGSGSSIGMRYATLNRLVTGDDTSETIQVPGDRFFTTVDGKGGDDTAVFSKSLDKYFVLDAGTEIAVLDSAGPSVDLLLHVEHLQFADGTITPDDGSALFDTVFYDQKNLDVFHAGVNALQHFNQAGWHEGRDPDPYFSVNLYLAAHPDVKASGMNPLDHYDQVGWHQGFNPGPGFDTKLYLMHNPDVAAAGVDPLAHWLGSGTAEGRPAYAAVGSAVNGFDAEYYLFHNPDVAAAGVDPLAHYNAAGWKEGRNPNPWFDTAGYLAHYQDVAAAGVNPLQHYEQTGWKEGRDPSAQFDTLGYLAANPDVAAAHVNPLDHFINSGIYEGRVAVNDGVWH